MCEFISYIEKRDVETNALQYLYLTDEDIFSSRGRELFRDCRDNDCLGHGAIRLYFSRDGKPLQGGKDCEVKDFWNTERLPPELAAKVKEFDRHWGKMFQKFFQNDDLRYIIDYAPKEWKAKASERLLKQKPTNDDLCYIIDYAPEEWKAKASERLLKQKPTNSDLCYIIDCAPKEWKAKAWERLLKQKPTNDDLRCIIYYAPEEWKAKASERLLKQKPTNSDLCYIIDYAPKEWKAKARALLG